MIRGNEDGIIVLVAIQREEVGIESLATRAWDVVMVGTARDAEGVKDEVAVKVQVAEAVLAETEVEAARSVNPVVSYPRGGAAIPHL